MPQVQSKRRILPTKWRVIILVAVFVLVAAGSTAAFWYLRQQDRKVVVRALERRQTLVLQGKFDDALKLLREAYPKAHTKDEQSQLVYHQATTNLVKGDYDAARRAYKDYEAIAGLTFEAARQLGYIEAQQGNKTEAIAYYNKAIELVAQENNPQAEAEASELRVRIEALQQ